MKSVLLINDDPHEAEIIASVLRDSTVVLSHANTGREALALLMGIEQGDDSARMNPDFILIRNVLPDMTAYEMCNVLRNYYRFSRTRFYVIAGPEHKTFTSGYDALLFAGKIERPITVGSKGYAALEQLKQTIHKTRLSILFPLVNFPDCKSAVTNLKAAFSGALKIGLAITCIAGMAFAPGANENNNPPVEIAVPKISASPVNRQPVLPVTQIPETVIEPEPLLEVENRQPETVFTGDTTRVSEVEEISLAEEITDTLRTEKSFSIGCRPQNGTK